MNTANRPTVTTRPYTRSHGNEPRGAGNWAFQRSDNPDARDDDLYGDLYWHNGSFAEARRAAQAALHDAEYVAALP